MQSDTNNLHVHVAVNRISPETYRAIQPAGWWTRKAPEVSQTVRDIEAHTGEQSSERIAMKETVSILREAVSWDDLHRRLAERGFTLERKGNGAVLNCGGTFVKLSKISLECSFSKLEARLGDFQERDENVIVNASSLTIKLGSNTMRSGRRTLMRSQKLFGSCGKRRKTR